jgi:hypothetical protein
MNESIGRPLSWIHEGSCIRCTSHALNAYGYPRLRRQNKQWPIARWILSKRFPESFTLDIVCRHTCDNAWCINPNHIIPGSHTDNMRDRDTRERQARGERQGSVKLNPTLVRQIRALKGKLSGRKIAAKFGMGRTPIRKVLNRITWKHV